MTRPNVKDKVIAFHRTNPEATARQCAQSLGLGLQYVWTTAERNGFRFKTDRHRMVVSYLPEFAAERLDAVALERGMTVAGLSNKLLATIAMDGLVGAILDE